MEIQSDNKLALKPEKKRKKKKRSVSEKSYFDVMEEARQSAQNGDEENSDKPVGFEPGGLHNKVAKLPETINHYVWGPAEETPAEEPEPPKPQETRRAYYRYHRAYTSQGRHVKANLGSSTK